MYEMGCKIFIVNLSERHSNPFHTKTGAPPLKCHPWLCKPREGLASHFLMVTHAMRPGNWTVGGSPSVYHMTCLRPFSFREARNVPDYFSLFQPHPSIWNITVFCMESNYFSLKPQELCQQFSVQCAVCARVLSCNIHTAKSPLRRPQHNMWSNCEATITQARPDVINRPSDRRVKGQMSGVKVQLLLETVFICMCVDTAFLSSGGRGCWFITSRGMDSEVESSCSSVIYSSSGAEYWLESTTLLQLRGEAIQTAGTTLEVPTPAHLGKDTVELIISHA